MKKGRNEGKWSREEEEKEKFYCIFPFYCLLIYIPKQIISYYFFCLLFLLLFFFVIVIFVIAFVNINVIFVHIIIGGKLTDTNLIFYINYLGKQNTYIIK